MVNRNEALVVTTNITGRGTIVDLQHLHAGLPTGTELRSTESGKAWRIKKKTLFLPLGAESVSQRGAGVRACFSPPAEKLLDSKKTIWEQEAQNIYQYALQPAGHADQPREGEGVLIKGW